MNLFRILSLAVALWSGAAVGAATADTVRPEVGKPLQAAQELLKGQKYKEALGKIAEADAVPDKTPYEAYALDRMRAAAAIGAGSTDTGADAVGRVLASKRLSSEEEAKLTRALGEAYYRAKDYPKAISWLQQYRKLGGIEPDAGTLIAQAYYLSGNYTGAEEELQTQIAAAEQTGKVPPEERYQLLASCFQKQNDATGYTTALERLLAHYPRREYWADVLNRVQRKPGFSERLSLDVYRVMLATGNLNNASEYVEMAQLALQAGYPVEAKKVVDQGFSNGILGVGAEAARHKRLKDLAYRQLAEDQNAASHVEGQASTPKDGTALVNTGFNFVLGGNSAKGIAMIEQGIAKGGLKHPDEAQLHLGIAYVLAGRKDDAAKALKSVHGTDGAQDLARLWALKVDGA